MPDDEKDTATPIANNDSEQVLVGKRPKKFNTILALSCIGLALIALVLVFATAHRHKDTAVFSINDKSYSQDEVKKLTNYPISRKADPAKTTKQAFEYLKRQEAAKISGITISPDDINAAKKVIFGSVATSKLTSNDPWLTLPAYDMALQNQLGQLSTGGVYKGYSFIFGFAQHLQSGTGYMPPGFKDPNLVAADRAYAQERANYYYDLLKNNKIKPEDALAEIKKDPKLGYQNTPGTNNSVHFGYSQKAWDNEVYYQPVADFIKNKAQNGLNSIQTGKTSTVEVPRSDADYSESFFYVVLLESSTKTKVADFNKALSGLKTEYKGL